GGFFLTQDGGRWRVVDDEELPPGTRRQGGTIGARSAPYGVARVEVLDQSGQVMASATTEDSNHVWVRGLEPDTQYRYRVLVDGEAWAEGERWDWVLGPEDDPGGPRGVGRHYDLRLRTHPPADRRMPVTFLAMGDYGVGIVNGENGRRQQAVAQTLEHLAATRPVRFLVSLGDNIYHRPGHATKQTGDEDDDWYLTFYQPYRYLIDHLPLYPAAGNHDSSDQEVSDDRGQLADNFHLDSRFGPAEQEGRASIDPGLFYRLKVGGLLELLCLDTTWGEHEGVHHFDDEKQRLWLEEALPEADSADDSAPVWRIPFCHHPPYCAGPHHECMQEQIDRVVPLYRRAGVRLVLSGHEHNFQHGRVDDINYVVSGAAAKLQEGAPCYMEEAGTVSWAAEAHCLLVEVDADHMVVTPYGASGPGQKPQAIRARTPDGQEVEAAFVV
ncbi:MAG: metallophosphoesterase, partial [Actinomycetota bacterium]|nr:metallophosphoesterase [Actinomycetota bacterium]